jgi:hypothetical protein
MDILINLSQTESILEFNNNPFSGKESILFDWPDGGEPGRPSGPSKKFRVEGDTISLPGYAVLTCVTTNNLNGGE